MNVCVGVVSVAGFVLCGLLAAQSPGMDTEGIRLIPISDEEDRPALVALSDDSEVDWDGWDSDGGASAVTTAVEGFEDVAEQFVQEVVEASVAVTEAVATVPVEFVEAVLVAEPARAVVTGASVPATASTGSGASAATVAAETKVIAEMEAMERVRQAAQAREGERLIAKGKVEMSRGDYENAIRSFRGAIDFLGDRPMNASARRDADSSLAEAYYQNAMHLRQEGKLEAAREMAVQARLAGHPRGERLLRDIDAKIKDPAPEQLPAFVPRGNDPEFIQGQSRVSLLMARARDFYASGEYNLCRQQLELVLRDFPYETSAIDMLRRLESRRFDIATGEADATRAAMMREVREIWTPRRYAINEMETTRTEVTEQRPGIGEGTSAMKKRMQEIIIPEINFRQANLTDVITFLADASREYDPRLEIPQDRRGINLILSLESGVATPPADAFRNNDPFATSSAAGMDSNPGSRPITITARWLSLMDALDLVMQLADLKYTVRGNIVTVVPANAPEGDLYHRMYSVLPAIATIVPAQSAPAADQWGSAGGATRLAGSSLENQTDWKAFFRELGVSWPIGSSIQYMPNIGRLVVMNTADNLSTLETVLAVLNVTPKQIEIEARFVEVEQGDMESLGFEWMLNNGRRLWSQGAPNRDIDGVMQPKNFVDVMGRDGMSGATRYTWNPTLTDAAGNRTGGWEPITAAAGSALTGGFNYLAGAIDGIAENTLALSGIIANGLDVSMILRMLQSKRGTDLLSAPKVVTQNGNEATIKVVREYIYPTEYTTDPVMSSGGDSGTSVQIGAVVTPGGFAMREVGVILQVIPEVTPDGQMINLTMAPAVVTEPTWEEYGSRIPMYDANGNVVIDPTTGMPMYSIISMRQPIFPVRSISTKIQIYNGATVIMGGMITEERITQEDKIPILGDIPFIGRLFRSRWESSRKRNLLIFVTARLVDPAGVPVQDSVQNLPLGAAIQ